MFIFSMISSPPRHYYCSSYFIHLLFLPLLILLLRIEIFFPLLSTFRSLFIFFCPCPFYSPCLSSSSSVYLFPYFCIFLNLRSSALRLIVFCLSSHTFLPPLHTYLLLFFFCDCVSPSTSAPLFPIF